MKNKLITSAIIIVLIAAGAIFIFTGTSFKPNETKQVVKVGYLPLIGTQFVAQEMGFFENAGLEVELVKFTNSNLVMEALSRGDIDATATVSYSTLLAFESRSPGLFKLYEGWLEYPDTGWSQLVVKTDSTISSPEDLVGKKIAMRAGLASRAQGELILNSLGLDADKVEFVQVEPSLLVATFVKPEISAYLDIQPIATELIVRGLGKSLISSPRARYVMNPYPVAASALGVNFIQDRPAEAKQFVQVIEQAIEFIDQNPDQARAIFKKYLDLDEAVAQTMPFPNFGTRNNVHLDKVNRLADIEVVYKILDNKPDISHWIYQE